MWQAFIERRDFGPAVEPRAGEIALNLLRAGAIDFCDLIEQHGSVLRGRVVSADQHRKLAGAVGSSVMPSRDAEPVSWHPGRLCVAA
jgi:hypothetical protein